jgi:diguanylate cyclase (GGDEF)-like protein
MPKVLIVEDSRVLARALHTRITTELGLGCDVAGTLSEAEAFLSRPEHGYAMALLDLTLPDAQGLDVVDQVRSHAVPVVVFTGAFSDELRAQVVERNVIDYVLKDSAGELAYVVGLVGRFLKNADIEVLVVDDSRSSRHRIGNLLRLHNFKVLEAEDGARALEVLAAHPTVRLLITDFNMPGMDGCELIHRVRKEHPKETLAIIGISGGGNAGSTLSARFLKGGANDFIAKPFINEEFNCRVRQNIEQVEHLAEIRNLTFRDPLTGLWNRRHLFDKGARELVAAADGWPVSVALIDIDHFKRVNDTMGHAAGDTALRHVAQVIARHALPGELVTRLGGEEFCLLTRSSGEEAERHFEELRAKVAGSPVEIDGQPLPLTISIGSAQGDGDIDEMLARADEALYQAKDDGRNRVVRAHRMVARV